MKPSTPAQPARCPLDPAAVGLAYLRELALADYDRSNVMVSMATAAQLC